jgi:hypothetical protein
MDRNFNALSLLLERILRIKWNKNLTGKWKPEP